MSRRPPVPPRRGFTLIELIVVLALIGLLVTLALPRHMAALDRGREKVLQHNLAVLRQAIDRHHGDRGRFPDRLEDLVERRYLRAVPLNPYTEQADWITVPPSAGQAGQIADVRAAVDGERLAREREAAAARAGDEAPAGEAPGGAASAAD